MKRTYKLIASRGNEIVYDDRLQADSPRDARREMKKLLGLASLSGPRRLRIVDFGLRIKEGYATDARRIEARSLCSAARVCAADWKTWCCPVVLNPQSAIHNPQSAIRKRHFRRYGNPEATAAKYGIGIRDLNARARREAWS